MAKVWDSATGHELLTLSGHTNTIFSVKFCPDGRRVATGNFDGMAKVWDAATGKVLLTLSGHTSAITDVDFSPDGTRVATASSDGTVKVWDASTTSGRSEQPLTLYNPNGLLVTGVAFSPDGKRLAVSANDGTARIYALSLDDIISIAKSRVTRALTNDECQKYLHVDKCPGKP